MAWDRGGVGDADYLYAWQRILIPMAKDFAPDLVLISAGFDAARGDPLGGCNITPRGYATMTRQLLEINPTKVCGRGSVLSPSTLSFSPDISC